MTTRAQEQGERAASLEGNPQRKETLSGKEEILTACLLPS